MSGPYITHAVVKGEVTKFNCFWFLQRRGSKNVSPNSPKSEEDLGLYLEVRVECIVFNLKTLKVERL